MGLPQITPLTFDKKFDLSKPQWQLLVQRQLADLFEASKVATGVTIVDNVTEATGVRSNFPHAWHACMDPSGYWGSTLDSMA